MAKGDHILVSPRNRKEWVAYHTIRRKVLDASRGNVFRKKLL